MPGFSRTKDDFALPVDSEHKALSFPLWSIRGIHMLCFHLSWISVFISFFSTFAPAALLPVIRQDLDLTSTDLGSAAIASVSGVISARIGTGALCDMIGPKFASGGIMLLTAPAVFASSLVNTASGFIACRFLIGFSLATFVACQFWSSVMFNVKIVGNANATGAGWGNTGAGTSLLLMPFIFEGIGGRVEAFVAWRYAMWVPGFLHIISGGLILAAAQDMPDGSFCEMRKRGEIMKPQVLKAVWTATSNHRMWLLAWLYGYSFGVELLIENILVSYFFDNFNLNLHNAGVLASVFGLLNVFSRTVGGLVSDKIARAFGMRGRLITFWVAQTLVGVLAIFVGLASGSLAASVALLGVFSFFVQAAEGACFGIVPFVSKRALGVVIGFVGAGGSIGSAILHALFFRSERFETDTAFVLMGLTVLVMSQPILLLHFPQWGGILSAPNEGFSEEDYYLQEYSSDEIAQGDAHASLIFAVESRAQRGQKRVKEEERIAAAVAAATAAATGGCTTNAYRHGTKTLDFVPLESEVRKGDTLA
ncbi:hypothetical protein BSKO_11212 [Bryopsis sp. KO-2023]|nr:hypothetical protein BSKO_11212 [Bryopsis sp. KO-2023]